jgi:hypothetical protein
MEKTLSIRIAAREPLAPGRSAIIEINLPKTEEAKLLTLVPNGWFVPMLNSGADPYNLRLAGEIEVFPIMIRVAPYIRQGHHRFEVRGRTESGTVELWGIEEFEVAAK